MNNEELTVLAARCEDIKDKLRVAAKSSPEAVEEVLSDLWPMINDAEFMRLQA